MISLYAEDAIFEIPLVPAILDTTNSALEGKTAIRHFLEEGSKRRPNETREVFRTGEYLTNRDILMWEYPRITDNGEQINILEVMEIEEGLNS